MRHPVGKGYFIWLIEQCAGGDPQRLAQMAQAAGLAWATLKTHNGIFARNGNLVPYVSALRAVGVECWGWGYCYGVDPIGEAKIAASQTEKFGLVGYFIDAEVEYKAPGMGAKAKTFMNLLLPQMQGKPIGLCAYRFPSLHGTFPWNEFLDGSDFHAPQVYWLENNSPTTPGVQLERSIRELKEKADLPFVPIGVASPNDAETWSPSVAQVDNFNEAATNLHLPGVGWWSWQHAEKRSIMWNAISAHQWTVSVPPVVSPHSVSVGLHGRADGRMQQADFDTVRQAKIEAVKLMSTAAPEDVDTLRSIRPDMLIMVRLFADFRGRIISPADFAKDSGMVQFYNKGIRLFEIHNEPNLSQEGLAMGDAIGSWRNGQEFGAWFADVRARLKTQFPEAKLGFPGLSPGAFIPGIRMDEQVFMAGSQLAALAADWIGLHVYWADDTAQADAFSGRAARELAGRFPNKPIYITEFSSIELVAKGLKGAQYVQFYKACQSFPSVVAAFSFVVSSSHGFSIETWRDEDGTQTEITGIVGRRSNVVVPPVHEIVRGSKIGIHSFLPSQVIPLVQSAVTRGVTWSVVKAIADAGVGERIKAISPSTITITRFVNLAEDSAQDVDKWSAADMERHARSALAFAMGNTTRQAQLRAGTDYIEPLNEADPPGVAGHTAFGKYLCEMVRQADALGIHIGIPGFNSGTPEWSEMLALSDTGLFKLMKAGSHILTMHEGTVRGNPVDLGFGDGIPGAPTVPGAGSQCFRYRYLYHILRQRDEIVPLVISEFYASGSYTLPVAEQVRRFVWYDRECRKDYYVLSVLPFTVDAVPGGEWSDQNYTYAYPAVLDYLVAEKNLPNATEDDSMDEPTRLALIADWDAVQDKATNSLKILDSLKPTPQPLYKAKILSAGLRVRDAAGMPGILLLLGTVVEVWSDPPATIAGWQRRVKTKQDGSEHVWAGDEGTPTLQKL